MRITKSKQIYASSLSKPKASTLVRCNLGAPLQTVAWHWATIRSSFLMFLLPAKIFTNSYPAVKQLKIFIYGRSIQFCEAVIKNVSNKSRLLSGRFFSQSGPPDTPWGRAPLAREHGSKVFVDMLPYPPNSPLNPGLLFILVTPFFLRLVSLMRHCPSFFQTTST